MKTKLISTLLFAIAFVIPVAGVAIPVAGQDWSQFRGSNGSSATEANVPVSFDEDNNIAWKSDLPGKGVSSPIVIGDRVIVTASGGPKQDELYTVCFDKQSGKQLWSQQLWATGRCLCHPTSANAAPTPASDGEFIFSFYSSNDLACFDLDGNLIWFRGLAIDHPKAGNDVGMSSSPVAADGVVVAQVEGNADAFVIGIDVKTGKTIWEVERKKNASWASPLLITGKDAKPLVLIQSQNYISALELKTGKSVFEAEGQVSAISSAALVDGRLFVPIDGTTAYNISDSGKFEKAWNKSQIRTSTASGVIYNGQLLTVARGGVLKGFQLSDGNPTDSLRVGGNYWATPVAAGDFLYFFSQDGVAKVVDLKKMEVVHECQFKDESFSGSPAVSDNALFIRSNRFLYKIAEGNDS